jgi:hypothetical protein
MEWVENKADINGNYTAIPMSQSSYAASELIRYSPRQVTLQPGERQTVKLMLRRKSGPQLPEYRSHLSFTALPPRVLNEGNGNESNGINFKIDILTTYVIPVMARTQEAEVDVKITSAEIFVQENEKAMIQIKLSKIGAYSSSGKINVYFTPNEGNEKLVGILNGVNIFHDNQALITNVIWQEFGGATIGKIRVEYLGTDEFKERTFDIFTKSITLNDYKKNN